MKTAPLTLTQKDLATLLTAAGRAPSGGNIQPWLVSVDKNQLTVKLNPKKLGTILDINNYGSLFALGAFALNLEIAAQHLGLEYRTKLINQTNANKFTQQFTFINRSRNHPHPLYQAVLKRDTNRQLANSPSVKPEIIKHLQTLTTSTKSNFRLDSVSTNEDKATLAKILGKADLIRTKNTPLLKQMLSELRWTTQSAIHTKDGVDIRTMELPGNVAKMLQLLAKFPSMAKTVPDIAFEKQAWPMLKNSSHLCILSLRDKPNPQYMFEAGYVMQRLWLETTNLNLAIHPWTVLTFFAIRAKYHPSTVFNESERKLLLVSDAKLKRLLHLSPHTTPVFIFRLSYSDPPSARSSRYNWNSYTTIK